MSQEPPPEAPQYLESSAQEEVSLPMGSPDWEPLRASHLAAVVAVSGPYSATALWGRSYPSVVFSFSLRCRRSTPAALPEYAQRLSLQGLLQQA